MAIFIFQAWKHMKSGNEQYSHPVLGDGDSISGSISCPYSVSSEDQYIKRKLEFIYENNDIESYINIGLAVYACEVTCSRSLYRHCFTSSVPLFDFSIKKSLIIGQIEVSCLILSTWDITNYTNSLAHPDYNHYSFDIEAGEPLADFGSFNYSADIDYLRLKAVDSIFQISLGNDEVPQIDLDNEKITLLLPEATFNIFSSPKIKSANPLASVTTSSLVLNSLLIALYNYEPNKNRMWARALEYRMTHEDRFKNLSLEEPSDIPTISQLLIENPMARMIEQLDYFYSMNQNEDY